MSSCDDHADAVTAIGSVSSAAPAVAVQPVSFSSLVSSASLTDGSNSTADTRSDNRLSVVPCSQPTHSFSPDAATIVDQAISSSLPEGSVSTVCSVAPVTITINQSEVTMKVDQSTSPLAISSLSMSESASISVEQVTRVQSIESNGSQSAVVTKEEEAEEEKAEDIVRALKQALVAGLA